MKYLLVILAVLLTASALVLPCIAGGYEPSTDQVLNAYIEGCLAQDFKGPIEIESYDVGADSAATFPDYSGGPAICLKITTIANSDDVTLRAFEVGEIASDLKDISSKVPNLWKVECVLNDGDKQGVATLEWEVT